MLIERLKRNFATMPLAQSLNPSLLQPTLDMASPTLRGMIDDEVMGESITQYARAQRKSGAFREKVLSEGRPDIENCLDLLRLNSHNGRMNAHITPANPLIPNFYLDSDRAFSISYHGVGVFGENTIGCVIGFNVLDLGLINSCGYIKTMNGRLFEKGDILIDQIQATSTLGTQKVLGTFRWEKVLVGLVIDWAAQNGLNRIFIRPAKYNKYTAINNSAGNRGHMRYDITAKRMGFKILGGDLPHMLDLSQAPLSDEVF